MSDAAFAKVDLLSALPRRTAFRPLPLQANDAQDIVHHDVQQSADAYSQGFDEGQRIAAETFATDRQNLLSLLAKAEALQPEPSEELAALVAETICTLVTEIVGAVEIDHALLDRRIAQAMAVIGECDAARTLALNPYDIALLGSDSLPFELVADPSLARGEMRLDCSSGWIEHGSSIYLETLRNELGISGEIA